MAYYLTLTVSKEDHSPEFGLNEICTETLVFDTQEEATDAFDNAIGLARP